MLVAQQWKPAKYQERAVQFLLERGAAGIFADPGMRKTSIMLAAFKLLQREGMAERLLVVVPKRPMHLVWPKEIRKWKPFNHFAYTVLHGRKKNEALQDDSDIFCINPEGLPWLARQKKWQWPDMLVVDESTRFKHSNTKRFKLVKTLLPKFERRYILTGTPIPNGLLDLFGQIYLLDMGHALGAYITHYRMKYFFQTGFGGYTWVPYKGSEKRIYKRLTPLILRIDEKDHMQLPPKIETDIEVELPAAARRKYDTLQQDLIAHFENHTITAANAATLTGKLRQVANGAVYKEEFGTENKRGRVRPFISIHDEKIDATLELLEELSGQPTIVGYEFKHDHARLHAALSKVYGSVPDLTRATTKQMIEIETAWNNAEIPILLAQSSSAAHGLNLQRGGRALIFFALPWDLEVYIQLVKRLHRSGQRRRVFVHRVMALNTVDQYVAKVLRGKNKNERALLDALRDAVAPHTKRKKK